MIVGLTQIRGIGYMFANTILNVLKINPNQRIGNLSPEQVNSIESIIKYATSGDISGDKSSVVGYASIIFV